MTNRSKDKINNEVIEIDTNDDSIKETDKLCSPCYILDTDYCELEYMRKCVSIEFGLVSIFKCRKCGFVDYYINENDTFSSDYPWIRQKMIEEFGDE